MLTRFYLFIVFASLVWATLSEGKVYHPGTVKIININIIDIEKNRILKNRTVFVENGRISRVTRTPPWGHRKADTVIDAAEIKTAKERIIANAKTISCENDRKRN